MNDAQSETGRLEQPLCSIHTPSFVEILKDRGIALALSTYQAGKLVLVRAEADHVTTHFRTFAKPMGIAVSERRLAVGTATEIHEFHNMPAVAAKLPPAGNHDACFLPRWVRTTGDVLVHEMAYGADELWLVNTRFSCLCTLSDVYSFVPRWRPPFISALAPQDRCHLNGLGLRDGRPRYVTAHARSDAPSGWREQKKDGGILMDVLSNDVILGGLSMPHSARWHEGRLWLLESGDGSIGVVDLRAGRYRMVAELPGFKRGLDFHGPYAFVGLSQVRETAIFGGLALTERLQERTCGVWVIDTRSGQSVAALHFEAGVRAIFAVQVLAGKRYPELITHDTDLIPQSFVLPDESLKEVDPSFRAPPPVKQSGNRDKPADPA